MCAVGTDKQILAIAMEATDDTVVLRPIIRSATRRRSNRAARTAGLEPENNADADRTRGSDQDDVTVTIVDQPAK